MPTADTSTLGNLSDYCRRAFVLATAADWRSFDPWDVLAAPFGEPLRRRSPLCARILIQVGRHLGPTPRQALRVPRHEEAKALADFLSAACILSRWTDQSDISHLLMERLLSLSIATPHGRGWGLSFPCASRFVNAAAMTPNAYTTVAAATALLDQFATTQDERALEAVADSLSFLDQDLGWTVFRDATYLRYWPGLESPIVNVQAMAAGLMARFGAVSGDGRWLEVSHQLTSTVVRAQQPGGSWRYSEDGTADFIDSFHTGFILEGLSIAVAHGNVDPVVPGAMRAGLRYFREHLVDVRLGLPRSTSDQRVTRDPQAVAQCVQTLSMDPTDSGLRLACLVWTHLPAVRLAQSASSGMSRNHLLSLRWDLGPAVLASANLLRALEQGTKVSSS